MDNEMVFWMVSPASQPWRMVLSTGTKLFAFTVDVNELPLEYIRN